MASSADESSKENSTLPQNAPAASSEPAVTADVLTSWDPVVQKNPADDGQQQPQKLQQIQHTTSMEVLEEATVGAQDENVRSVNIVVRVASEVVTGITAAAAAAVAVEKEEVKVRSEEPLATLQEPQAVEDVDVVMREEPVDDAKKVEAVAAVENFVVDETVTEVRMAVEVEQVEAVAELPQVEIESVANQQKSEVELINEVVTEQKSQAELIDEQKEPVDEATLLLDGHIVTGDEGMESLQIDSTEHHSARFDAVALENDAITQVAIAFAAEDVHETIDVDMEAPVFSDDVTAIDATEVAPMANVLTKVQQDEVAEEAPAAAGHSTENQVEETYATYKHDAGEQWFQDDDGNADDEDELIPVMTEEPSDDDDEPVFVGTASTMDNFKLGQSESTDGAKRKRSGGDGDESDSTLVIGSGSEKGNNSSNSSSSSSSSGSSDSSSDSNSSGSDSDSDGEKRKHAKKARHEPATSRAEGVKPKKAKVPAMRRVIPPEYLVFNTANREGLPILRGSYRIKNSRRAVFTGHWGFNEADFAAGGDRVSKFEYTSVPLHGRHDSDRRPFSGKYSGFFNFRQFSGKIIRIKEDQVELNFLKMPREDHSSDEDDDDYYEEDEAADSYAKYEVYGKGKNQFGRFLIRGYLNPAAGTIGVRRKYLD